MTRDEELRALLDELDSEASDEQNSCHLSCREIRSDHAARIRAILTRQPEPSSPGDVRTHVERLLTCTLGWNWCTQDEVMVALREIVGESTQLELEIAQQMYENERKAHQVTMRALLRVPAEGEVTTREDDEYAAERGEPR